MTREQIEKLSEDERHIVRHSLGLNWAQLPYRNHFCASHGSSDYATCTALVEKGVMRKSGSSGYGDYFHVEDWAEKALLAVAAQQER